MGTFRDAILPSVNAIRAIPGLLGWRPYTVALETRTWSGAEIGQGAETVTLIPITERGQPPKTRWLDTEQLALAGYERATIEVGPITPAYPGGGFSAATLDPASLPANTVLNYELTGPSYPSGAYCRLVDLHTDHAGHFTLRLQLTGTP